MFKNLRIETSTGQKLYINIDNIALIDEDLSNHGILIKLNDGTTIKVQNGEELLKDLKTLSVMIYVEA